MAADWIKVRDNLHEDPAVGRISTALGIDVYGVIGRLIRIWAWADQQVENGHADVTHLYLDQLVNMPGMADSMVLVGWLEIPEAGQIRFPKYDRHMSKNAKKRALASRRKQDQRAREYVTQASRPTSRNTVTREEKSSSTNKHLPVANSRPVDKSPRAASTAGPTASRQPTSNTLKPPAAMTPEERICAGIADPPPGLIERYSKTTEPATTKRHARLAAQEPDNTDDELLERARKPVTIAQATRAIDTTPPDDWENTHEGIERAGSVLGMKRMPFEEDPDYAKRIHDRIALG